MRRDHIQRRIEMEIQSVITKLEEQGEERKKIEEENETLKQEFEALKGTFDKTFESFQGQWKVKEAQAKTLIAELTAASSVTTTLKETIKQKETTLKELQLGAASLQGQLDLYTERFTEFEAVASQSDNVYEVTSKQQAALQAKINDLQVLKKSDNEERIKADAEATRLRQQATQFKKKIEKLEAAKLQKEEQCRKLQARLKAAPQQSSTTDVAPRPSST